MIIIYRAERGEELRRAKHAVLRRYLPDLNTSDHRGSCRLVPEHMGVGLRDDLLPGTSVAEQAEQLTHRSAGYEQGRFLAHPVGRRLLQPVNGGVLAEHVVTERRARHGPEHVRGG